MATSFPGALDSLTNPTGTDPMNSPSVDHATQHTNLNDAIEALETKVGVDSSTVSASQDNQARERLITPVTSTTIPNDFSDSIVYVTDQTNYWYLQSSVQFLHFFGPAQTSLSPSQEMLYGYAPGILVNSGTLQAMTYSSGVIDNIGFGIGSSFTSLTVPNGFAGLYAINMLGRTSRAKAASIRQFSEVVHTSGATTRYYRRIFDVETTTSLQMIVPMAVGDVLTFNSFVSGDTDFYDQFLWLYRLGW